MWSKDQGKYAKEQADRAKLQADAAKESADYIKEKKPLIDQFTDEQTNLQAQVDTLIINGDSSPAAAQAAINAVGVNKGTLKARLDDDYNKVTQQLADTAINTTALKGDGSDNSGTLQNIFNTLKNGRVKDLKIPKSTYRINAPLFSSADDIVIDFSGSTLLSYANASGGVGGELGILNFHGELTDGDILNYIRTIATNPSPPSSAPTITSYEAIKYGSGMTAANAGRVVTSNNAYFSVGDEILIRAWTHTQRINYNKNEYKPELTVVAKVIAKDATYVYIDYYSPFKYPAFVTNANVKSVAMKVKMRKNITIKNLKIVDMATIETSNGIPTANDRLKTLCPISAILVDGIKLENVEVVNHRGNAFYPFYSRNIDVKKFEASDARLWDGGLGYALQFIGCRDIKTEDILGINCRHVVDYSWSSNAYNKNIKGTSSKSADLDLHGICEHDITFEDSSGYLVIGNGIEYFPNMVKNITLINCDIEMMNQVGFATYDDRFIDNVIIRGGKLKIKHLPMLLNLLIENARIDWEINPFVSAGVNKRGESLKTKTQIQDSLIYFTTKGNVDNLYLTNTDETIFKNVNFEFDPSAVVPVTGLPIRNLSGLNLTINSCKAKKLNIRFNSSLAKSALIVVDNEIEYNSAENRFVFIDQLVNCSLDLMVSDNKVKHSGSTAQFFAIQAQNSNASNSKITGHYKDNTLIGNANAKIHYIHGGQLDITKLDAHIYDYNNIVEFRDPSGSNLLSTTRNFVIS